MKYQVKEIPGYDGKYTIDTNGVVKLTYIHINHKGIGRTKYIIEKLVISRINARKDRQDRMQVRLCHPITRKITNKRIARQMIELFKSYQTEGHVQYKDGNFRNLNIDNINRSLTFDRKESRKKSDVFSNKVYLDSQIHIVLKVNKDLITDELREAYIIRYNILKKRRDFIKRAYEEFNISKSVFNKCSSVKVKPI